ncbi:hypothetical protein PUN28_002412 [Cardiocondyla obscurior]|uniref:Uncharacterized protein n=1 Tax=Cardiocondyla obscurior TaxID=286306 RepID=A0AAW2GU03_9HYME
MAASRAVQTSDCRTSRLNRDVATNRYRMCAWPVVPMPCKFADGFSSPITRWKIEMPSKTREKQRRRSGISGSSLIPWIKLFTSPEKLRKLEDILETVDFNNI